MRLLYQKGWYLSNISIRHRDKDKINKIQLKAIHFYRNDYRKMIRNQYLNHKQSGYHHRVFLIYQTQMR